MKTYNVNDRLNALLVLAKSTGDWDEHNVVDKVSDALDPVYGCTMTTGNVMHHLIAAYYEVINEPRFCIGYAVNELEKLIMSPVIGFHSVEYLGPKSPETKYTVKQFYTSMIMFILGQLAITRIDWCRNGG